MGHTEHVSRRRHLWGALCGVVVFGLFTCALPARAGLPPGDIVATAYLSSGDVGILLIDPKTGNRTVLSDNTHGTGTPFANVSSASIAPNGDLLVTDVGISNTGLIPGDVYILPTPAPPRVFRVDPNTGDRTVISQTGGTLAGPGDSTTTFPTIGSGPVLNGPMLARQFGNEILVSDSGQYGTAGANLGTIFAIDPMTGNRIVVSGGGSVGSGPAMPLPGDIRLTGNTTFVTDGAEGLLKIDLSTGNRTLVSGAGAGAGPSFLSAGQTGILGGQVVTYGHGAGYGISGYGVYAIDPTTGNRSIISSSTLGTGPYNSQQAFAGLAVEAGGTILSTAGPGDVVSPGHPQTYSNSLLTIDPATGNRSILSDPTHGSGPSYLTIYTVDVVPLLGDANGDGVVNGLDISAVASQWNHSGYFLVGDTNNDGVVNGLDISMVASHWLQADGPFGASAAAVPEPQTLLLAVLGVLMMAKWRARRFCRAR